MNFTDIFVHRPVLASVVSLLIFILGLRAFSILEVRQYPETQNTVVTITTAYPGAEQRAGQGLHHHPLAAGHRRGRRASTSCPPPASQGRLADRGPHAPQLRPQGGGRRDPGQGREPRQCPAREAENPVIDSTTGDSTALMYMAFYSKDMDLPQITDYLLRVVQPQLQALPGVAKAAADRQQDLRHAHLARPGAHGGAGGDRGRCRPGCCGPTTTSPGSGELKGDLVQIDLSATTDVSRVEDFRRLVVRTEADTLVRLEDIARVELGAADYDSTTLYKGNPAIFIGVEQTPGANPLDVAKRVRDLLPKLRADFPEGLDAFVPYDASEFIEDSIREVFKTLAEAVLIVLLVIFLSLGSLRAALIPAVAVPLSIVGAGLPHAADGLLHQPADPARHGARHRAGGGRRHRGGGERPPPPGDGQAQHPGGRRRGARAGRCPSSP